MESQIFANTDLMCNIIWLKVMLDAKDVVILYRLLMS